MLLHSFNLLLVILNVPVVQTFFIDTSLDCMANNVTDMAFDDISQMSNEKHISSMTSA